MNQSDFEVKYRAGEYIWIYSERYEWAKGIKGKYEHFDETDCTGSMLVHRVGIYDELGGISYTWFRDDEVFPISEKSTYVVKKVKPTRWQRFKNMFPFFIIK
jgi:hypothetical protein